MSKPAPPPAALSPRFSFKGWLFTTELKDNASFFKNLLNVDASVLGISQIIPGQVPVISTHVLLILGMSVVVAALKVGFDAAHYWFTEQTTPPTPQM